MGDVYKIFVAQRIGWDELRRKVDFCNKSHFFDRDYSQSLSVQDKS